MAKAVAKAPIAKAQTKEKNPPTRPEPAKKTAVSATVKNALPSRAEDFDALPSGLENVGAKDVIIPRLTILQGLSPQVDKKASEYIKGAEIGDICDIATGDVYKESMLVLPCFFATVYLQWAPRDSGRGLVANHGMDSSILAKCTTDEDRKQVLENGDYIAETATYFVLNISANGRKSFIPMASTQLGSSRAWMTRITSERVKRADGSEFMPPIYYRPWTITTIQKENKKGKWYVWKAEPHAKNILEFDKSKGLLADARDFYEAASKGLVQGDLASMAEEHASGGSNGGDGEAM